MCTTSVSHIAGANERRLYSQAGITGKKEKLITNLRIFS